MKALHAFLNRIVAAFAAIFLLALPGAAESDGLDALFDKLKAATPAEARRVEKDIWLHWSRSGSAAFDLLLERGRKAMEQGDTEAAIEHLTALTDHAPDFAEGWNARATAYFQAGQYGPSVADIQRVLTMNPRHFGALAGFGAILEELDRKDQALEVYRAALAIHPNLDGVRQAVERLEQAAAGQQL